MSRKGLKYEQKLKEDGSFEEPSVIKRIRDLHRNLANLESEAPKIRKKESVLTLESKETP